VQYYIYAENKNAASFSPARAEYEFYTINITGNLVINEFMADNKTTVEDQDGEYDDWIEFYNNGNEDINMKNYYLSDDASDPYQWIFPDTTILAGDYLIVWADKDTDQEGLHANFKLSSSGETIVLSDNKMNLLDMVSFLEQKPDTTTGRYENGTGDFIEMLPSFGQENTNFFSAIDDDFNDNQTGFTLKQNRPNPFTESTTIDFKLEKGTMVNLRVFSIHGTLIETIVSAYLPEGEHSYSWQSTGLPEGLYIYALSVEGIVHVKKMIKQ
ncbi:MAG TPA: T9SS type A sorting domain-containing protein, partial [Bacteroidetes bacterium]|nr:T9SS type A sorting domain-containing protein [Bacteroidota bacterium]